MKERKGFTRIPNWLISSNVLSTTEKMVVILVASFADGCQLSVGDIATTLRVRDTTVRSAMRRLAELGLLEITTRKGATNIITAKVTTPPNWGEWYPSQNSTGVPLPKEYPSPQMVPLPKEDRGPLPIEGSTINKIKYNIPPPICVRACVRENFAQKLAQEKVWLEGVCMRRGIDEAMMLVYLQDFANYCEDIEKQHESLEDAKRHFVNQLPTIIKRHEQDNDHRPGGAQRAADYAQRIAAIGATSASLTDDAW